MLISSITLVEVRAGGKGAPIDPTADARVLAVLDSPHFTLIDFHRAVALRARRYAQTMRLHTYDAIHLASSVEGRADVFMTWDNDFNRGQNVHGVWVDEPYVPGDPTLI